MDKKLNSERVSRALQLSQLESQLAAAVRARNEKEQLLAEENIKSQQRLESLKANERRLAQQDTELSQLKGENKRLIDDIATQRESVVALTNQIYNVKAQETALRQQQQDLSAQLALKKIPVAIPTE